MYKKERKREEEKNMVDYDFDLDSHTKLHIMGDCLYDYFNKKKEERSGIFHHRRTSLQPYSYLPALSSFSLYPFS